MEKSYNKDTFCVAPWVSMHLSTFENVVPCCLYKQDKNVFGKLKKGTELTEHYNSETAKDIRKRLWTGDKIAECGECWFREEVAINKEDPNSYRNQLNKKFSKHIDEIVANTNEDFSLKEVKFRMIDLRFDNKCNLKCRICSPTFSSALYKEYKELNFDFEDIGSPYNISIDDLEYNTILEQLHNVGVIFFAGGEPLTQDKYYKILEYCIENDLAKDITLWVTTNLTKIKYKKWDTVELWKKFKSVEITASIDGSYERGEYLRKGCSWEGVVANREYILKELPDLHFMIVPTVNIMNSYNIVELYKEWVSKGYIERERCHFNLLTHPEHLQIRNLPDHHKNALRKLYDETIEWIKSNVSDPYYDANHDIDQFNFVKSLLDLERNDEQLKTFVNKTHIVDKYRGDDFFKIFTELADLENII